jgi:hypothetical protein
MPLLVDSEIMDSPLLPAVLRSLRFFEYNRHLSANARVALFALSEGMRLRVTFDGNACHLVDVPEFASNLGLREPVEVPIPTAHELINSGLLWEMREEDEYTETVEMGIKFKSGRGGWRSAGLDGTKARFYCMMV